MERRDFLGKLAGAVILGNSSAVHPLYNPGAVPSSRSITAPEASEPANFPKGFLWGTATASYQVEGAGIVIATHRDISKEAIPATSPAIIFIITKKTSRSCAGCIKAATDSLSLGHAFSFPMERSTKLESTIMTA